MTLDKVVENIRREGTARAEAIKATAQKEASAILADAKRQTESLTQKRSEESTQAADGVVKREVANAELEARRLRLTAERELMTGLRRAAEERLAALDATTREAHLKTLVAQAAVKDGHIWVAKQDESIAKKLGFTVADTFEGLGGVIVESADGATRENLRYETLLDEIWGKSLPQVATKLLKE